MHSAELVVVGTGLAGVAVVREFRKLEKAVTVIMITRDDGAYYAKPQLSASLASAKKPDLLVLKTATTLADELNASVLTQVTVVSANSQNKTLTLSDGKIIHFEKLVLAVGANTRDAKIEHEAHAPLFSVNSLEDYRRFHSGLEAGKRVVILGSGLIGCEFANDLALANFKVTVVGNGSWPLQGLVPQAIGEKLREALAKINVEFRLQNGITSITKKNGAWEANLRNGESIEAEVFLSAIGFEPNLELAKSLGLETKKAISVNSFLQTSDKNIFALGDCAEIEGRWLPFVMPINFAAKALALSLTNKNGEMAAVVFPSMPVVVKTPAFPICVLPPNAEAAVAGIWKHDVDDQGVTSTVVNEAGELLGFALGGEHLRKKAELLKVVAK